MKKVTLVMQLLGAACLVSSLSILITGCGGDSTVTTNQTTVTTTVKPTVNANISVSVVPSATSVKPGETFDVAIRVKNDQPSRGIQFGLKWDPAKLECTSAEQGNYYQEFAEKNAGSLFVMPSAKPVADNTLGVFPKNVKDPNPRFMLAMSEARDSSGNPLGVTGTGDVVILHMTAKSDASGSVGINLSNVIISDISLEPKNMNPAIVNATVTVAP